MQNRTGQYVAQQRHARNLTRGQLARMIGRTNVSKASRRITAFERDGVAEGDLVDRIVHALDLDRAYVDALLAEDRREYAAEWERWANEPIEPELRFRVMAAVWCRAAIPQGLSKDEAIAYAKQRAIDTGRIHVLVLSRREELWCGGDGSSWVGTADVGKIAGRYSNVGGQKVVFG